LTIDASDFSKKHDKNLTQKDGRDSIIVYSTFQ
jgi:hypothetical protein